MTNPEGAWENPRTRKIDKFIPIEDVSEEDLAPGYPTNGTKNPEEELIAKQENNDYDPIFPESMNDDEWNDFVKRRLSEEEEKPHQEIETEYGTIFDNLMERYQTREEHGEGIQELMDKFHLSGVNLKEDIERFVSKHPKTGRSYGVRGRENPGKHKKGLETIRRPKNGERFDL